MSARKRRGGPPNPAPAAQPVTTLPPEQPSRRLAGWLIPAIVVVTGLAAWFGAGALTRRAQGARIPALPDLTALSEAGREQVREADRAARRRPTSAAAMGELGHAYFANVLMTEAVASYALADERDADDWRWAYYRALAAEERGEQERAEQLLTRVTAAAPGHSLAWFRLGEIAFKQGRLDVAASAYDRARAPFTLGSSADRPAEMPAHTRPPLEAYADVGLARIAFERGQRDDARARLQALVQSQPTFGSARALLVEVGETTTAIPPPGRKPRAYVPPADPFLDAVVGRSHHSDLLLKHAALATRAGEPDLREYLVRRALAANPRGLDVLLEAAAMLQERGRATEALDYLRQAEQVAPGDHHVLVEQGRSLSDLGRLDEAEEVLRRATRVRDAAAEYNLGSVLDRKGRSAEARTHYERAMAIDPFHARAMNNIAVGFDRSGNTAAALALYSRALQAAPDNAETYSNLGSALIGARRFGEAIQALEKALTLDPRAPDAHNNMGIALAQSGRLAEARAQFAAALELYPGHVNARRNLERIDQLGK